ncbi:lig_chan-Glu_bd domain-containing protein [Trichonephila clavipes]|uniref:Lig_chan-Glu_bd domain-containing protein n=1 Tax=Trichonephila clavipes TaxID=2585209 RepID=A0A8X6W533_TRICX|nr:lig_chan-Glu_bd domain-containing protein [Trichonephila clavipes]
MKFPSTLKVSGVHSPNFFITKTPDGFAASGNDVKLLNILAEKLNFKYTIQLPTDNGFYGILDECGNWTGVTGLVVRGEVDMAVLYMDQTEERWAVVDYAVPHYVLDKTIATDVPGPVSKNVVFISPFQTDIWITIICLFVIPKILRYFPCLWRIVPAFLFTIYNYVKYAEGKASRSMKRRILEGSYLIADALLKFIYMSVLLSFLTVELKERGLRDMKDLAAAVQRGQYKVLMPLGGFDDDFLLNSDKEDYKIIGKAVKQHKWYYVGNTYREKNIGPNVAIGGARMSMQVVFGKPPFAAQFVSEDSYGIWNVATMVRKGFCCKAQLDTMILRVNSAGLYQKFVDDTVFRTQYRKHKKYSYEDAVKPLTLEDLFSIFLALGVLHFLSFVVFLIEFFCKRFDKRI